MALGYLWLGPGVREAYAALEAWIRGVPDTYFITLILVLPLLGCPIAALYVCAGLKYGNVHGLALVAGASAFHLVGSWALARLLGERLKRRFSRKYARLLDQSAREFPALFIVGVGLMPVVPYAIKNYVLALSDLRFGHFFWITLPIHILTATPGVLVGNMANKPPGLTSVLVGIYTLALVVIVFQIRRRLQDRFPT